jgi:hypothetical protein
MTALSARLARGARVIPGPTAMLAVILAAGLLLRLVLAYVVFAGQGFATDLSLFQGWASTLAQTGPGSFYAAAGSANYPPGYLYVLWSIGVLATPVGALVGVPSGDAVVLLLKLPPIAADLAIAALLYWAGRRWFGDRTGLVAAALYLFIPVTWYDSAIWGQVEAVGTLVMLAALVLLIEGWSEPAAALAIAAVLVKPQNAICLVVLIPVLLRRHLIRVGSGPVPGLGPRLSRLNRRLDGLVTEQGPVRLATSALLAGLVGFAILLPFDLQRWAPTSLADVPVVAQVAGLVGLFISAGGEFSWLTVNAYNAWALVGPDPLAAAIGAPSGAWTPDSLLLPGGLPAVAVGAVLLCLVGFLVAGGLLVRDGRVPILLGFAIVAFAFYALPTRVHERYLFPFFAPAALLAAGGIGTAAAYVGVGFLNAVNIHAVLAAPLEMAGGLARGLGPGGAPGRAGGLGPGALGPGGPPTGSGPGLRTTVESVVLPLADAARSELAVTLAALGQTAALVALLAGWFVVVLRPAAAASRRSPEQGHAWRPRSLHLDEEGPIAEPLGVCSQPLDDL